jgi:hypothetical protein
MLKSYDLFDTLIARRCVSPLVLLEQVQQQAGIQGLAQARAEQGHRLWMEKTVHTTPMMYAAALTSLGLPDTEATNLASMEYAIELQETIPVLRHLEALEMGDLVISDMHHPDWVLHQLLRKAQGELGRRWPSALLRTNRGKHDGDVWRRLRDEARAVQHLGDNAHSDHAQAIASGHQASVTHWTLPTQAERLLAQAGAGSVMRAARSARLRCVGAADDAQSPMLEAMANVVFPVLAVGAAYLHDAMKQLKKTHLVFCGRDGATWMRAFHVLFPNVPATLLPSSRHSLVRGGDAYSRMIKGVLQEHGSTALLVDLCGTATSWAVFFERWKIPPQEMVMLLKYAQAPERLDGSAWADGLIDATRSVGAMVFEALCEENYPSFQDASALLEDELAAAFQLKWFENPGSAEFAGSMHGVLDVALQEWRHELLRSHDQMNSANIKSVMMTLLDSLAPLRAEVERLTRFSERNRQAAGYYAI